jgi:acyl-coenzyme A synthetase/AMP-(fatty) acid ligase
LGAEVESAYGSTEGGVITLKRLGNNVAVNNVGKPVPGAQVMIIGDDGTELPTGQSGEIRVKGASMAPNYYRDAAATARHFVDGWFVPGDRGYLNEDGDLIVEGRDNAVLNVGGVKIDAALMERMALTVAGVTEAGITTAPDANAIPRLVCVLAVTEPDAMRNVDTLLRREFANGYPSVYIAVDALPRNSMGKLMRDRLQRSVQSDVARVSTKS